MDIIFELIKEYEDIFWIMGIISIFTFLGTFIAIPIFVAKLPTDYLLIQSAPTARRIKHPVLYIIIMVIKNILGMAIILAGIAMLVLPGEGLLTILIGFALMSFPQKAYLIKRLIKQKKVLQTVNWIRTRRGRPVLLIPENAKSKNDIFVAENAM